ncbi:MAG TPA: succinyldiaminopimelate transaminase [Sporichthyaceae bacterium]|nr:succinyldiaminopimelate transaminase [Sporichthyaceae bacterium]
MRSSNLPDFPWDRLNPAKERAITAAGPAGLVDLSVGTPVDPAPKVVQEALAGAADAPGYPLTSGTPAVRAAIAEFLARRFGVAGLAPTAVLPAIGSKELVAWLPRLLGLGSGDVVAHPHLAYPTYEVGARLAGATPVRAEEPSELDSAGRSGPVGMVWVNSPANPSGRVLPPDRLRELVAWARAAGAVLVSDECYAEFGWDTEPVSVLHPDICGGSHAGLLAVHSASKRSNLAGYRAAFLAGDPGLVAHLLEVRKHAGMMLPTPVQAALVAALTDTEHVAEQRERYAARRATLRAAVLEAGFRIDESAAGLYLWTTRDEDCWATVGHFADRGILVAPGEFYGPGGRRHVRIALTATDERIAAAAQRLTS